MGILILAGFCMVLTTFLLMARINLKRFLGYPNIVDVTFTLFMLYAFAGTFSGAAAGAIAGIFMSVMLWACRCTMGAERLSIKRGRFGAPKLYWRTIHPCDVQPHWLGKWTRYLLANKHKEA